MTRFTRALDVAAPVSVLWAFHARPEVLQALMPPWERGEVVRPPSSLAAGTRVEVRVFLGPVALTVEAEHVACDEERRFVDVMRRGPFRWWRHEHRFEPVTDGASRLVDDVEYEVPGGWAGRLVAGGLVTRRLERLFAWRHQVTRAWCETLLHAATLADWEEARRRGAYRAPSLTSEGFIHCSTRAQIGPVLDAFFPGRAGVVVLEIDARQLAEPVRWEPPAGPAVARGPFPHVYGEIPLAAVRLVAAGDGTTGS
jgi:ligand-binding SRPBCC domain-containing protein